MPAYHSFKYRIYPDKKQCEQIDVCIEAKTIVYNKVHAILAAAVRNGERLPSPIDIGYELKTWKGACAQLKQADSQALLHAIRDAHRAWVLHFQNPSHFGLPRAKLYDSMKGSYRTTSTKAVRIVAYGGKNARIRLPKLGFVKLRLSRNPLGRMKSVTIEKRTSGKYFVAICCEEDGSPEPSFSQVRPACIDAGGDRKAQAHADRELRRLLQKTYGSNNHKKQRRVYARACERAANIRRANRQVKTLSTVTVLR